MFNKGMISKSAFQICKIFGFETVDELKTYYLKHKSFRGLDNCEGQVNEELLNICSMDIMEGSLQKAIYNLEDREKEVINDFIREEVKKLSLRARNSLGWYLNEKFTVINLARNGFFNKWLKLTEFRRIGKVTAEELKDFLDKVKQLIIQIIEQEKKVSMKIDRVKTLSPLETSIINDFIALKSELLSNRSINALTRFLEEDFSIHNIQQKGLLNSRYSYKRIVNIGAKSAMELKIFFNDIKVYILKITDVNTEKDLKLSYKHKFLIQNLFPGSNIPIDLIKQGLLFLLTDFLINNQGFYDKRDTFIFKKVYKLYFNQDVVHYSDIGDKIGLTGERVRQIRSEIKDALTDKILKLKHINVDLTQYGIDLQENIIRIDNELVNRINTIDKVNFSKMFIAYLLSIYLGETYTIFLKSDYLADRLLNIYYDEFPREIDYYLVNKKIVEKIDFDSLLREINDRMNKKIEVNYSFNFRKYLSETTGISDSEVLDTAFPIAKEIVNNWYDDMIGLDNEIVFRKNTLKRIHEYAYEALKILDKPTTVKGIYEKIVELNPSFQSCVPSLRSSMLREPEFVSVGRKSVYGLKKWEETKDNFKSGTIGKISEEYLEQFDCPIHIYQLGAYVQKYRPKSKRKNIMQCLKVVKLIDFVFFKQGFIGLGSKLDEYDVKKYEAVPSFLGKKIIKMHRKGQSIEDIRKTLIREYNLDYNEANNILNYLEYFKEIKESHKNDEKQFKMTLGKLWED